MKTSYLSLKLIMLGIFVSTTASFSWSQELPSVELVQSMTSAQLQEYWSQAQSQGYTLGQLEQMARLRGVSEVDIQAIIQRIQEVNQVEITERDNTSFINNEFGIIPNELNQQNQDFAESDEKLTVFGKTFFQNPNINLEPNLNIAVSKNYQLGPGDEISIDIWGAAQKNYTATLSKKGTLVLENLAPIFLNGLTLENASKKIKSRLAGVYSGIGKEIGADVYLNKARSVIVNIIGEVEVPGTYSISSLSTPINALYAAGGPNESGSFRSISVIRNGKKIAVVDIYSFLKDGTSTSMFLQDNDVLLVPSYQNRVYLEGAAKTTGAFELLPEETAADLLYFSGGFTSEANKKEVLVERIHGATKKVLNISENEYAKNTLDDGDRLIISTTSDAFTNRVSIQGEVNVAGAYPIEEVNNVKALLEKTQGFTTKALLSRALIYREENGFLRKLVSFNINDVLDGKREINLQANDSVVVLSSKLINSDLSVQIKGQVVTDSTFTYYENMKVGDLIALAGGLKYEAENSTIDIYRNNTTKEGSDLSKRLKASISADFTNATQDFTLEPKDIVVVRKKEAYFEQKTFTIEGLVKKPGIYVLRKNRYTLYDALNDSGGVLDEAFIAGIHIKRRNANNDKNKLKRAQEKLNDVEIELVDYFTVAVKAAELLDTYGSPKYNIELKEGDRIIIPKYDSSVALNGAVNLETAITYSKKLSFKKAIYAAGGYAQNAKRSKTFVIYPNGEIATKKHFLFITSNPRLKPGSTIVVPTKEERAKMSAQEIIGITSGFATLGVLIRTLTQ
ncbi:MAG: SLBB domain-containing protein [Flavobacteriaceae bacterium]